MNCNYGSRFLACKIVPLEEEPHISQKLQELNSSERSRLLTILPDTAPLSWKHINFQGEYDFSEGTLRNLVSLELDQLLKGDLKQF